MGTIDDYLAGLDPADAAIIAHTYDIAREVVPDAEQGLGYGMPALVYRGKSLLSVMRAKKHFGIFPFSPGAINAVLPLLDALRGISDAGFVRGSVIDDAVVEPTIERALDALAARCTVTGQELRPGF